MAVTSLQRCRTHVRCKRIDPHLLNVFGSGSEWNIGEVNKTAAAGPECGQNKTMTWL